MRQFPLSDVGGLAEAAGIGFIATPPGLSEASYNSIGCRCERDARLYFTTGRRTMFR